MTLIQKMGTPRPLRPTSSTTLHFSSIPSTLDDCLGVVIWTVTLPPAIYRHRLHVIEAGVCQINSEKSTSENKTTNHIWECANFSKPLYVVQTAKKKIQPKATTFHEKNNGSQKKSGSTDWHLLRSRPASSYTWPFEAQTRSTEYENGPRFSTQVITRDLQISLEMSSGGGDLFLRKSWRVFRQEWHRHPNHPDKCTIALPWQALKTRWWWAGWRSWSKTLRRMWVRRI